MEDFEELRAEQENGDHVGNDDEANGHKATPTDADLSIIADLYGVSVAYLRGEVDAPASNVKNAMPFKSSRMASVALLRFSVRIFVLYRC